MLLGIATISVFFSNMAPSGKFMEQWGETEIKKICQILSIGEYHYTHLVNWKTNTIDSSVHVITVS
jgi:hypothetical protein